MSHDKIIAGALSVRNKTPANAAGPATRQAPKATQLPPPKKPSTGKSVAAGAGRGALVGAELGSVVPGAGTAVGATVGSAPSSRAPGPRSGRPSAASSVVAAAPANRGRRKRPPGSNAGRRG
jgi:hypothetical protein